MDIKELSALFCTPERVAALKRLVASRHRVVEVSGLAGSALAMLCIALPRRGQPYLVIAADGDEAGYLYNDLVQLTDERHTLIFPSGYKRHIKYGQPDAPNEILRTEVLSHWHAGGDLRWVVTSPEALAEKVAPRELVERSTIALAVGDTADMSHVIDRLVQLGFVRVDYVYEPGQFAVRGSLLDVFSFSHELPLRIDFFGDEIDSIRSFNVETQLSEQPEQQVSIVSQAGEDARGVSLLDYVGADTMLVCRSAALVADTVAAIAEQGRSHLAALAGEGNDQAMQCIVDPDHFASQIGSMRCIQYSMGAGGSHTPAAPSLALHCAPQGVYHKNFDLISDSFTRYLAQGYRLFILSDSEKQVLRLRTIFTDRGDDIGFEPVLRTLHEGFVDEERRLCVFTDHQIFDRFHKYSLRSERARSGKLALSLKELNQIEVGDYIVHEDHGIGKFGGLLRTGINGTMQEMIKLVYLNGDQVFVPIHALRKLSKYRGREGEEPRLSKLGSGAWQKMKARAKGKIKDIARELIQLYAARRGQEGFAFSPDSYLQQELEASFIYEDTPDQLKATQAVKADMERTRPMDRLVCGDVGFGKTEVAIRAAFKAAVDGKQTAVLVPTTVLAFQHYNTFSERLRDFPVRVDYLSRARKPKEVRQVLADLADGKIDIIIGTHKLVGKTVKFHDLGLLVIDEEQKFGVAVKERLRQLKVNIDTLTMSATPIPRTLQFSVMGARDLSTIHTPPPNRYPIYTTLANLSDDVIHEAVNFELSRNGQVFIVSNRIENLHYLETKVRRLVPDARVVVGHGQMPPEQLEEVIIDFAAHDYDVLLATTIIENGVDMPNVNTIIIHNAQNFGLSELHQLRGRVGRSNRKAFCYLLVPALGQLLPMARRRLQAIESFSDLGAGINIAMQDLDIRGAGNLLGAEQSGFIADLGYETYQRILKEAVLELRTQEFADTFADDSTGDNDQQDFVNDCTIDTDLELLLPAAYVPQENERITLYRELDGMETDEQLADFEARLVDRFGPVPDVARELIRIVPLRRHARALGIEKIALRVGEKIGGRAGERDHDMYLYFVGQENVAYYQSSAFGRILNYLQRNPMRCKIREKNGRRSLLIGDVPTVSQALDILQAVGQLPPV
ncbi:MAG: transcription-repair coupling factor [Muribaculaceae bacterium]|nr:transcription-repair coupling factor [Muribaculaceae bacterium]